MKSIIRCVAFFTLVALLAPVSAALAQPTGGAIVAWGYNTSGQCNVPTPNTGFTAVAAGCDHSLGLKIDGSIVAWGSNGEGQCTVPSPNSGFTAVVAGNYFNLGLKTDGSIVAWGANVHAQCDVPTPNTGFAAIAAGNYHSLGLKADGSIVAWGYNPYGQCNVPTPNTGFTAVAAGCDHSLGLKIDGSIVAWGRNTKGQCNVPLPNTGFMTVAAGDNHSLGLKADGSIIAWGYNGTGQCTVPSPNTGFTAEAAGLNHSLGLKAYGAIVAWGGNTYGQCNVPLPNTRFTAVAVGVYHSLGLQTPRVILVRPDGSGDYPTIQAAMNAAAAGDTIVLADGTFRGVGNRDLDPNGKSLTIRSLSDSPADCVIECEGSAASPHRGFYIHNYETMTVCGVTVRGGYQATGAAGLQCGVNSPLETASVTVENCVFSQSEMGAGMHVFSGYNVIVRRSVFAENHGTGLYCEGGTWSVSMESCTFTRNTGAGAYFDCRGGASISDCAFIDNGGDGLKFYADFWPVNLAGCTFIGNGGSGLQAGSTGNCSIELSNCTITGNQAHGITGNYDQKSLTLDHCQVARNALVGVQMYRTDIHFTDSEIVDNLRGGVILQSLYRGAVGIQACRLSGNGGVGLRVRASTDWYFTPPNGNLVRLGGTLVCDNDSAGVQISTGTEIAYAHITTSTIAHNGREGLAAVGLDSLVIDHSLLTRNGSDIGDVQDIGHLSVSCTDNFGNAAGDWTGALGSWFGTFGNIAADPLFCAATASDYTLSSYSPCASPNSGVCGQIGAMGMECTTPATWQLIGRDEPNDQGGKLRFLWGHHPSDAVGQAPIATYYELQRLDASWTVAQLVTATKADTYSVIVDTPDTLTIGQPAPVRDYRLIARTSDPLTNFVYPVVPAYSVDNLPPPAPVLVVEDDEVSRTVYAYGSRPSDHKETCFYKDQEPGFTAGDPIQCGSSRWYDEDHRIIYYYRARDFDIHGNASEWSNEVTGQYPTDVPGAAITQLRLYPSQPNPFNPLTTIRFDLPVAGHIRLTVYDVAGRLIRTLVEADLPSGTHEATWDGRDSSGRGMASGSYLARLEAGGKVEAVRMSLVR